MGFCFLCFLFSSFFYDLVKEEDKINKPESEPFVNVDGDEDDEQCSAKHCLQPTGDDISWVQCDKCQKWYHLLCIGECRRPRLLIIMI